MSAQEWARRHPELAAELVELESAGSVPAAAGEQDEDQEQDRHEVVLLVRPTSLGELAGALALWSALLLVLVLGRFVWGWDSSWLLVACGAVGVGVVGVLVESAREIARRLWWARSH